MRVNGRTESRKNVYFVSGIDTGIGKTAVTGLMARSLASAGRDVITVKLVQTGNDGYSEDIDAHRLICGGVRFPEDGAGLTAPQVFKFPSSPLLAAALEGRTVDLAAITRAVDACAARHEIVLVESAGGLAVPLTEDRLTVDYAAERGWPLILVPCGRLGSINHTLLSLEAAKARGMPVAGVVHNWFDARRRARAALRLRGTLPRRGLFGDLRMTPLAWDRTHIWHPYASLGNPPPVLLAKRASGVEIELDDGQRLVDAV